MGGIATLDKKGSHFQRFGLKIFVLAANAARTNIYIYIYIYIYINVVCCVGRVEIQIEILKKWSVYCQYG